MSKSISPVTKYYVLLALAAIGAGIGYITNQNELTESVIATAIIIGITFFIHELQVSTPPTTTTNTKPANLDILVPSRKAESESKTPVVNPYAIHAKVFFICGIIVSVVTVVTSLIFSKTGEPFNVIEYEEVIGIAGSLAFFFTGEYAARYPDLV